MLLKRCKRGHYFDADMFSSCPACVQGRNSILFSESQARQVRRNLDEAQEWMKRETETGVPRPASRDPRTWTVDQLWTYGPYLADTGVCAKGHLYDEHMYGLSCPYCTEEANRKNRADIHRCANGHIYDAKRHKTCPRCAEMNGETRVAQEESAAPAKETPVDNDRKNADGAVSRCSKGHAYISKLFDACPICEAEMKQSSQAAMRKTEEKAAPLWDEYLKKCKAGHFYNPVLHKTCPFCDGERTTEIKRYARHFAEVAQYEQNEHNTVIARCRKGHSYNSRVYDTECPVCSNEKILANGTWNDYFADRGPEKVWRTPRDLDRLEEQGVYWNACLARAGRTRGHVAVAEGLNAIGRGAGNHIVICGDETIAFKEHAFILCDSDQNVYYLIAGRMDGKTLVNGQSVGKGQAVALTDGDHICFGETEMVFFAQPQPPKKTEFDATDQME